VISRGAFPPLVGWPIYLAALAAQFAFDFGCGDRQPGTASRRVVLGSLCMRASISPSHRSA
jgi:hypothetical protein